MAEMIPDQLPHRASKVEERLFNIFELRLFLVPKVERGINLNNSLKEAINDINRKAIQTGANRESAPRDRSHDG